MAWGLDEYPYQSSAINLSQDEIAKQVEQAQQRLAQRKCYASCPALLAEKTKSIEYFLTEAAQQPSAKLFISAFKSRSSLLMKSMN
jgi:hypothetical protein